MILFRVIKDKRNTRVLHEKRYYNTLTMFEIKVLVGAPTGCTSPKNVGPGISPCTLIMCSYNTGLKKRAHTGCTPNKEYKDSDTDCIINGR